MKNYKFKVGQKWREGSIQVYYTISDITNGCAWSTRSTDGKRVPFINVDSNYCAHISDSWNLVSEGTDEPVKATKKLSRECPCGIFRGDCTYHKG